MITSLHVLCINLVLTTLYKILLFLTTKKKKTVIQLLIETFICFFMPITIFFYEVRRFNEFL